MVGLEECIILWNCTRWKCPKKSWKMSSKKREPSRCMIHLVTTKMRAGSGNFFCSFICWFGVCDAPGAIKRLRWVQSWTLGGVWLLGFCQGIINTAAQCELQCSGVCLNMSGHRQKRKPSICSLIYPLSSNLPKTKCPNWNDYNFCTTLTTCINDVLSERKHPVVYCERETV